MTELKKFSDAFATVQVATYQPLILKWYSGLGLFILRNSLARRAVAGIDADKLKMFGESAPTSFAFKWRDGFTPADLIETTLPSFRAVDPSPIEGGGMSAAHLKGRPRMVTPVTGLIRRALKLGHADMKVLLAIDKSVSGVMAKFAKQPKALGKSLAAAGIPAFLPGDVEEALSPVGIAHLYRQLYFDLEAGVGPIEQVFSVAPSEEVEIIQETVRRTVMERIEEFGSETTMENQVESRNLDEISDQVNASIKSDLSVAISADVGVSYGVYNVGAQASTSASVASERSTEHVKKATRELNRRSSEQIRKSYKLQVRSLSEVSERSEVRRLIKNDTDEPVNYALRRVLRKVKVKVQDLGPRLVWQLYVSKPGEGLALSKFVMFQEAQPIAVPDVPPGSPPRPEGRVTTGTSTSDVKVWNNPVDGLDYWVFDIRVAAEKDYVARTVTIDGLSDASPGGKDDVSPGFGGAVFVSNPDGVPADGSVVFRISLAPGTAEMVTVQYTLFADPSPERLSEWQAQVDQLRAAATAAELEAQFDRAKKLITAKSRIQPRPAMDLRKEERYEIMNRMISHIFSAPSASGTVTPLEIEYFHRYFEEPSIFYYMHPSWWVPRYAGSGAGYGRTEYEITDDSEPAPLGRSLGWAIQLDGDRRRNEFINSPWVRVCVPIRPGFEREAIQWLASHLEGEIGYDTASSTPIGKLLKDVEDQRRLEGKATTGPDYVTLDGQVAPTNTDDANAFPVISEFDIVLPTDGFAYDKVTIAE